SEALPRHMVAPSVLDARFRGHDSTGDCTSSADSAREKRKQRLGGRVRRLFRQIVPAVDGKTANVRRPFPPGCERAVGPRRNAAGAAPDRQHRTGDLAAGGAALLVVGEIGGAAGAIILTGGMDTQRSVEERMVVRERARIEGGETLALGAGR